MTFDPILHSDRGRVDCDGNHTASARAHIESLSIVIPAYNEEARIGPTLDFVTQFLRSPELSFGELIIVDDGSTDNTAAYVKRFASDHPAVRLIRNTSNKGKGYSVRCGVLEAKGQWILYTDADLSTPVNELSRLHVSAVQEDAAVAIGSRGIDRSLIGKRQSLFRETSGVIFNQAMRLITGLRYKDTQCGFKLYRADAARRIFGRQRLDGFGFDVENLYLAELLRYGTVEVPVRWNNSEGTKVSGLSGLRAFIDLLRIRWYHKRSARDA